ncbi:MAG TPA: hypothetical protein VNT99_01995 [Methylomirabilota bacterium]|nr:hypothetical protein [Methylomirabilota bacterium]
MATLPTPADAVNDDGVRLKLPGSFARSAGFQPAVSQNFILQNARKHEITEMVQRPADCKSALRLPGSFNRTHDDALGSGLPGERAACVQETDRKTSYGKAECRSRFTPLHI